MATVQLADIIDAIVFQDLPAVNSPEKTAFFQSGIAVNSPLLNQLANSAGKTAELPFWNDLDETSAPNLSTDDPGTTATPGKITQGEQIARKAFLNKGWSASDLASELAMGPKAMQQIRARTDTYWTRQWQRRLMASLNGVLADNVANDAGDMVNDVAVEIIGSQTAATKFSRQNYIDAAYTMGDMVDGVVAMAVHSAVMKTMAELDVVEDVRDADGQLLFQAYMGARLIVDDSMTVTAGTTSGFKYTSVLFGQGAVGYGEGTPDFPTAIQREEDQGNGAGVETLWTRKTWLLHPAGFADTGTPASTGYTLAELATATTWNRVVARKNAPIAFLITN